MKKYIVLIILLFALPFNLQATQIGTRQIKNKAITTAKLDDSAVDDTKLEAVLKAKIPTADEKAAMTNASSPDAGNPFATTSDIADKLDAADSALFIWKDGSQDFTADQSMGGFSLTNMDEPAADSEGATKHYVDQGLADKLDIADTEPWQLVTDKVNADSAEWDAAYEDSHIQGTDQKLDDGGGNEVSAAELRTHVDNLTKHRVIDDNATGNTDIWSAEKITSELADKLDIADSTLFVWKDGTQDFTANQSMGGFKITSAGEATADSDYMTKWGTDQGLAGKQATGDYLEDGDFSSNGLMKRTGAGVYSIITDNSTYWEQMSDEVASDSPNWDAAYTLKGVLDALDGLMKCDGAGNYSIITDNSSDWNTVTDKLDIADTEPWELITDKVNADSAGWDLAVDKTDGTSFGTTPSSAPTADYEFANKKYVDDNVGIDTTIFPLLTGVRPFTGEQDFQDGIKIDTIVESTVGAGVNIEEVPIKDGNVDGRDLSVDGAKLDGIESNATADQSDTEIEALLAGLTGADRLSSDSLKEGATNLFITSTQETDWQAATDKVEADSPYWDLMCDKVNDDSAIWADKYTQAQITAYLALKLDIADSPVISDIAYNADTWNGNTDAPSKNAVRDKVETMNTAIGLNTAKDTNVSTNLSEGTSTDTTVDVNSSDGNNATLQPASTSRAGVMSKAKFDEVVANNAKDTNVSTALSEGTRDDTTYGITSDGGADDIVLPQANTNEAGLLSGTKFDEIVANTAKANPLTRYLHWSPAYDGYALSADGGSNDAGDSGILVAFAGTLGDSAVEDTPYIELSSTTAGVTDYDVIVRIPIPTDYSSMGTFRVEYDSDTVLEDTATVSIYDSTDAADSSVVLSSSAWAVDETMTPSGTYTAGEHMTIKLHLECAQNQKMRVGEIRCSYTATR